MLPHWKAALAVALMTAPPGSVNGLPLHPAAVAVCWGDVNGDKRVDVADAHLIARFAIGMRLVNREAVIARGDVTGDGRVNVTDAQQVARYSVGLSAGRRLRTACSA